MSIKGQQTNELRGLKNKRGCLTSFVDSLIFVEVV